MISWQDFIEFKRKMAEGSDEEFNPMDYEDEYEDAREFSMGGND